MKKILVASMALFFLTATSNFVLACDGSGKKCDASKSVDKKAAKAKKKKNATDAKASATK